MALFALPLNGCLYLGPITLLQNLPPVVAEGASTAEGTVTLSGVSYTFLCAAADPEDEELSFTWNLSESGALFTAIPQEDPQYQVQSLKLDRDESLDGQTLECRVSDGEFTDKVGWTIEVL